MVKTIGGFGVGDGCLIGRLIEKVDGEHVVAPLHWHGEGVVSFRPEDVIGVDGNTLVVGEIAQNGEPTPAMLRGAEMEAVEVSVLHPAGITPDGKGLGFLNLYWAPEPYNGVLVAAVGEAAVDEDGIHLETQPLKDMVVISAVDRYGNVAEIIIGERVLEEQPVVVLEGFARKDATAVLPVWFELGGVMDGGDGWIAVDPRAIILPSLDEAAHFAAKFEGEWEAVEKVLTAIGGENG